MGGLSRMIWVGPNAITGILSKGRQRELRPRGRGKRRAGRLEDAALQDRVMPRQAEGAGSHQRLGPPLEPGGSGAPPTPGFGPRDADFRLLAYRTVRE